MKVRWRFQLLSQGQTAVTWIRCEGVVFLGKRNFSWRRFVVRESFIRWSSVENGSVMRSRLAETDLRSSDEGVVTVGWDREEGWLLYLSSGIFWVVSILERSHLLSLPWSPHSQSAPVVARRSVEHNLMTGYFTWEWGRPAGGGDDGQVTIG